MNSNIILPADFSDWKLTNPNPQEQIDYFNKYPKIKMFNRHWDEFYCVSIEHKGFHCTSCLDDEDYSGIPNFDNKCCCRSESLKL